MSSYQVLVGGKSLRWANSLEWVRLRGRSAFKGQAVTRTKAAIPHLRISIKMPNNQHKEPLAGQILMPLRCNAIWIFQSYWQQNSAVLLLSRLRKLKHEYYAHKDFCDVKNEFVLEQLYVMITKITNKHMTRYNVHLFLLFPYNENYSLISFLDHTMDHIMCVLIHI